MVDRVFSPAPTSEQPPYVFKAWPSWRYGPDGQSRIFNSEEEVPEGWVGYDEMAGGVFADNATAPAAERPRELTDEQRSEAVAKLADNNTQAGLAAILFQMEEGGKEIEFLPSWPKRKLAEAIVDNGGPLED